MSDRLEATPSPKAGPSQEPTKTRSSEARQNIHAKFVKVVKAFIKSDKAKKNEDKVLFKLTDIARSLSSKSDVREESLFVLKQALASIEQIEQAPKVERVAQARMPTIQGAPSKEVAPPKSREMEKALSRFDTERLFSLLNSEEELTPAQKSEVQKIVQRLPLAAFKEMDKNGNTVAMLLCIRSEEEAIRGLIDSGKIEVFTIGGRDGKTPLHVFCASAFHEADFPEEWFTISQLLIKNLTPGQLEQEDHNGFRSVDLACTKGHPRLLQLFVESGKGELLSKQNIDGQTPLHLLCIHQTPEFHTSGHTQVVEILGNNLSTHELSKRNSLGESPADIACRYGQKEIVHALIRTGNIELFLDPDMYGDTPFHLLCSLPPEKMTEYHLATAQLLIETVTMSGLSEKLLKQNDAGKSILDLIKGNTRLRAVFADRLEELERAAHSRVETAQTAKVTIVQDIEDIVNLVATFVSSEGPRDVEAFKRDAENFNETLEMLAEIAKTLPEDSRAECLAFIKEARNLLREALVNPHAPLKHKQFVIKKEVALPTPPVKAEKIQPVRIRESEIKKLFSLIGSGDVLTASQKKELTRILKKIPTDHLAKMKGLDGNTAALLACSCMNADAIQAFIDAGKAEIFTRVDQEGLTPFHRLLLIGERDSALPEQYFDVAELLIKNLTPDQLQVEDKFGRRLVDLVSAMGRPRILQLFVACGKTELLTEPNRVGNTALHTVCLRDKLTNDHIKVAEILGNNLSFDELAKGNREGDSAVDIACKKGHKQVVDVLIKAGKIDLFLDPDKNNITSLHLFCDTPEEQMTEQQKATLRLLIETIVLDADRKNKLLIKTSEGDSIVSLLKAKHPALAEELRNSLP